MNRARRLLAPSILTAALLAALVLAASASAEIRVGEATAPVNPAIAPEADLTAARAEYDSNSGTVTLKLTTAAAPSAGTEAEPSGLSLLAGLINPSVCSIAAFGGATPYPLFLTQYSYAEPGFGRWQLSNWSGESPETPGNSGSAAVSITGATTTITATAAKAVNQPYSCALALAIGSAGGAQPEPLAFPLVTQAPPPPPAPPAPAPAPAPVQPAPAALSIAKLKPVQVRAGKWKTVRIKIADTGGSSTAPGSLRLKAPKGALVKPEKQKVPVLTAGGSWTLSAKVQLTEKAKKKSTIKLTVTAGNATATGSLVLKRQG